MLALVNATDGVMPSVVSRSISDIVKFESVAEAAASAKAGGVPNTTASVASAVARLFVISVVPLDFVDIEAGRSDRSCFWIREDLTGSDSNRDSTVGRPLSGLS